MIFYHPTYTGNSLWLLFTNCYSFMETWLKHDWIFGDGLWNKLSVHGTANISLITSIFEINNFHYIYWKHEEDVTISFINFLIMLYFHLLLFLLHVNEQFLLFFLIPIFFFILLSYVVPNTFLSLYLEYNISNFFKNSNQWNQEV